MLGRSVGRGVLVSAFTRLGCFSRLTPTPIGICSRTRAANGAIEPLLAWTTPLGSLGRRLFFVCEAVCRLLPELLSVLGVRLIPGMIAIPHHHRC